MQVGEDVVSLIAEFGDGAPRARHIHSWVRGLNALVADLGVEGAGRWNRTGMGVTIPGIPPTNLYVP